MRKQILLSGAAALAVSAFSVPAFAADPMPIVQAPTTVATYVEQPRTWTGGYVGGHASIIRGAASDGFECVEDDEVLTFAWVTYFIGGVPFDGTCEGVFADAVTGGSISVDLGGDGDSINGFFENEIFSPVDNINGYGIGAQIGYLRQLGNGPNGFVIGGEVAATLSSAEGTFLAELNDGTIDVIGLFELNAYATATLRAGFAFGPALIYAEGGLAIGSFAYSNNTGFNGTDMAHGYVYGGGIEGRISDHVTLFFEYNRVRLNNVQMVGTEGPLDLFTTFIDVDTTFNVFKTGFNIQFGGH